MQGGQVTLADVRKIQNRQCKQSKVHKDLFLFYLEVISNYVEESIPGGKSCEDHKWSLKEHDGQFGSCRLND